MATSSYVARIQRATARVLHSCMHFYYMCNSDSCTRTPWPCSAQSHWHDSCAKSVKSAVSALSSYQCNTFANADESNREDPSPTSSAGNAPRTSDTPNEGNNKELRQKGATRHGMLPRLKRSHQQSLPSAHRKDMLLLDRTCRGPSPSSSRCRSRSTPRQRCHSECPPSHP